MPAPACYHSGVMVVKIVSGGQTGVDRAALDFALFYGIACGGWCPKGRLAEDGPIPSQYPLFETSTADYPERTEKNVVDSDGTVIFSSAPQITGGTKETADFAAKHRKPLLHISGETREPGRVVAAFIREYEIRILNVAGPRASKEPWLGEFVRGVLAQAEFLNGFQRE